MKKYFITILFCSLFSFSFVFADTTNTGFIPGQIWYSKLPLVEGETVKVHTVVWNGDDSSLSARVQFYDQNVILGSRDIVVAPQALYDVSTNWQVTAGDHTISAKIISSKVGDSASVVLERRGTDEDKVFVPKLIKNSEGDVITSTSVVQEKVDEVSSKISSILPEQINTPITETFSSVDKFRDETFAKISTNKDIVSKQIELLGVESQTKKEKTIKETTPVNGTEKPIAMVKLFFLQVLGFIFGNKFIFYAVGIFLVFIIFRFIFRKIRNR